MREPHKGQEQVHVADWISQDEGTLKMEKLGDAIARQSERESHVGSKFCM